MIDNSVMATSLELLDTYVRIPTISSQIDAPIITAVQNFWHAQELDFEKLYPGGPIKGKVSNPTLFAEIEADVPDAPALLLYGHWDVQPTGELADWHWQGESTPPFAPTFFLNDKLIGRSAAEVLAQLEPEQLGSVLMVARGSADNKGQHLANILGVLRTKKAGRLQWQVKILLDGEEEIGSPNLGAITQTHQARLKAALMVGSDGPKNDNLPTLLLGVRGLLALEIRCQNRSGRMLHSGNYGNVVPNPVGPMARLLDQMEATIKAMGEASDSFRRELSSFFDTDAPDRFRYEPFLYPTFNVNSLISEGATTGQRRTIIPSWVEASIDVRLTPDLPPSLVYDRLAILVAEANAQNGGVTFELKSSSATASSYTSPAREGYSWLRSAMADFWGADVRVIPLLGGTLPNDVFTDGLGMASYWLPAANSNNRQHDTCEHLVLEHFFRQQEFYAQLVATPYNFGK